MARKKQPSQKVPPQYQPDRKMLEMLVCPLTKTTLEFDEENEELVARATRLAYPVRDGIPIMIPSEARPLEEDELR